MSEAALEAAAAAICVVDTEGRVALWNRAAAALTGISSDRFEGHTFQQSLLFPEDIDQWKREFDRISGGAGARHFETRWKSHDGSPLSLTASCSVIRDSAGNTQNIVCTVIDNSSREWMKDRTAEFRDMARFLHDTISQDLVALSYIISYLETSAADQQPSQTQTISALDLIDRCCRCIRMLAFMLAPPSLPETTLEESIELYMDQVREETGLAVTAEIDPIPVAVPLEAQALLFAAVQKWVAHWVWTRGEPAISARLRNGAAGMVLEMETVCVAPAPAAEHTGGWAVIRERARALGGKFDIAGDSTRVIATISLPD